MVLENKLTASLYYNVHKGGKMTKTMSRREKYDEARDLEDAFQHETRCGNYEAAIDFYEKARLLFEAGNGTSVDVERLDNFVKEWPKLKGMIEQKDKLIKCIDTHDILYNIPERGILDSLNPKNPSELLALMDFYDFKIETGEKYQDLIESHEKFESDLFERLKRTESNESSSNSQ